MFVAIPIAMVASPNRLRKKISSVKIMVLAYAVQRPRCHDADCTNERSPDVLIAQLV